MYVATAAFRFSKLLLNPKARRVKRRRCVLTLRLARSTSQCEIQRMTFASFFSVLSQDGFWRFGLSGRRTACAMEVGRKVASNHCNLTRNPPAALVDDPPSTFRPTSCSSIRFMPTLQLPTHAATVGTRDRGGCCQRQPTTGQAPASCCAPACRLTSGLPQEYASLSACNGTGV